MSKGKINPFAVEKHRIVFAGTAFERCAECPGCAAGMNGNKTMNCSCAGAKPVAVTAEQAELCRNRDPLRTKKKATKDHRIHPIFKAAVIELAEHNLAV